MLLRKQLRASFVKEGEEGAEEAGQVKKVRLPFIILFALVLGVFLWIRHSEEKHLEQMLLRQQLSQLRNAVVIYMAQNSRFPTDLKALAMATLPTPGGGAPQPLLQGIGTDKEGRLVDPMGYPYIYDPVSGMVSTTAPCCRIW
jgi:hypothetical protein